MKRSTDDVRLANDKTPPLPDDILVAFHQACDQDDIEAARRLLKVFRVHDAAAAGWSWW